MGRVGGALLTRNLHRACKSRRFYPTGVLFTLYNQFPGTEKRSGRITRELFFGSCAALRNVLCSKQQAGYVMRLDALGTMGTTQVTHSDSALSRQRVRDEGTKRKRKERYR